ncbi:MAG TPA: hypothetical protein VJQ26_08315 [Ktedonobacteraceae bacterium]|nr:hypothetical protein [Ktedonobacteraceae bacterium]
MSSCNWRFIEHSQVHTFLTGSWLARPEEAHQDFTRLRVVAVQQKVAEELLHLSGIETI